MKTYNELEKENERLKAVLSVIIQWGLDGTVKGYDGSIARECGEWIKRNIDWKKHDIDWCSGFKGFDDLTKGETK